MSANNKLTAIADKIRCNGILLYICGINTEQNGFGVALQGVNYNFE